MISSKRLKAKKTVDGNASQIAQNVLKVQGDKICLGLSIYMLIRLIQCQGLYMMKPEDNAGKMMQELELKKEGMQDEPRPKAEVNREKKLLGDTIIGDTIMNI